MFPLLFLGTTCAYNENLTLSKRKTAWRSARRDCNSAASLQRVSFILRNFFLKLSDLTRAAEMPFAPAFIERVATSSHIFSQPSRMPPVICRISALFRSPDCAYFRSLYIYITFLNLKQTFVYRILNLHANIMCRHIPNLHWLSKYRAVKREVPKNYTFLSSSLRV